MLNMMVLFLNIADIPDGRTGEPMTNQEREVMYERVADQLAQIADNYEVLSPSPDAAEGEYRVLDNDFIFHPMRPSLFRSFGIPFLDKIILILKYCQTSNTRHTLVGN